jgi:CHAT domain-containing protein
LIAFADPALTNASGNSLNSTVREWAGSLGPLPYARNEVKAISKLYPGNQSALFFGQDASEDQVKNMNLQKYRYIHFASHGLIDEENPQYSALVLASKPGSSEDGFLTLREVFDLQFNADLVVLSACKTGLGKQIRGEGVSGLSRAFLSAGTSEVLVSLWNVYDASTSEFMVSFYKNLENKKMSHPAALKQARIEMIHSGKFNHPYYWSPFVLIGDNSAATNFREEAGFEIRKFLLR